MQQITDHLPAFEKLREAHIVLLRHEQAHGIDDKLTTIAQRFINAVQASGVLIESSVQRHAAQSIIDYWVTALLRVNIDPPIAILAEYDHRLAPNLPPGLCPYVGLDAFQERDRKHFFGRERLVTQWIERLAVQHVLIVIGLSGTGKSSAVLSGLIPALKHENRLPGSNTWRYYDTIVPGAHPLESLARAIRPTAMDADLWKIWQTSELLRNPCHLSQQVGVSPTVFVVDQFEELFTLCTNEPEQHAFINNLLNLVEEPNTQHRLILTMRVDHEAHISGFPRLKQYFDDQLFARANITPLSMEELRDAIEKPAQDVKLKFDDGVVDALVREIVREPTGLPLLQLTLQRLWDMKDRNRITMHAYRELRGVRNALALSAESEYKRIREFQPIIERMLLKMVEVTESEETTRRRILIQELYTIGYPQAQIDEVIRRLDEARLIRITRGDTVAENQVEVAHEALIRNWPRFSAWIADHRESLRRRNRLTSAAKQWDSNSRDEELLWGGSTLDEALRLMDLNPLEREFLEAGVSKRDRVNEERETARQREFELEMARRLAHEAEHHAREQRKRVRWLIGAIGIVAVLLMIAIGTSLLAWQFEQSSRISAERANAALVDQQTSQSKALNAAATANTAVALQSTAEKKAVNAGATTNAAFIAQSTLAAQAIKEAGNAQTAVVLQRTAQAIAESAALGAKNQAATAQTESARRAIAEAAALTAQAAALSAVSDKETAIQVLADKAQELSNREANLQTQQAIIAAKVTPIPPATLTAIANNAPTSRPTSVVGLNPNAQKLIDQSRRATDPKQALQLALKATEYDQGMQVEDTLQLAIQRVKDASGLTPKAQAGVRSATWSADSRYILAIDTNGFGWVFLPDHSKPVIQLVGRDGEPALTSAAWSSDGTRIVAGSTTGKLRIYNVSKISDTFTALPPDQEFQAHNGRITGVSWSPDDTRIISSADDLTIKGWVVNSEVNIYKGLPPTEGIQTISRNAFSPDGQFFATGSRELAAEIHSASTGERLLVLRHAQVVTSVSWSPDGTQLLTASEDGVVRIWNIDTTKVAQVLYQGVVLPKPVSSANWSPSGRSVIGASRDGIARIWNAVGGNRISILEGGKSPLTMATWSPDGKRIVTSADDGSVRIYMVIFQDIVSQAKRLGVGNLTPSQLSLALQGQLVPSSDTTPTPAQP